MDSVTPAASDMKATSSVGSLAPRNNIPGLASTSRSARYPGAQSQDAATGVTPKALDVSRYILEVNLTDILLLLKHPALKAAKDPIPRVLASVDGALSALATRLDDLSRGDSLAIQPTLIGETATQITLLLESRQAALRFISP